MIIGPVFSREAMIAPRRISFYATPAVAVAALLCLLWTFWQISTGNQPLRSVGDSARFGAAAFAVLAPLELAVTSLFAALLATAAVGQEKERKTLVLLLLTRLSNAELVLGKLLASLLTLLLVIAATLPFYLLLRLLGGVSVAQIARVLGVTLASAIAVGSLGSTFALWREKAFQSLAMTALALVVWILAWEGIAAGILGHQWLGSATTAWAVAMSPWQAVLAAADSDLAYAASTGSERLLGLQPVSAFLVAASLAMVVFNGIAIALVRVWNPSRGARAGTTPRENSATLWSPATNTSSDHANAAAMHRAPGRVRRVWDQPILWREVCTWAYGKKILVVHAAYLVVALLSAVALHDALHGGSSAVAVSPTISPAAPSLVPLMVVSVILVNALAVTSITSERDGRALDLLRVTDLTAAEIIVSKLGGVFYNSKLFLIAPLLLAMYVWWSRYATTESLLFLVLGYGVMQLFAATLGLHCGMIYANSRQAIAVSLGTLLFLCVGISVCMRMMLVLGRFDSQLTAFLGFIAGGGIALYAALGWKLPSKALALATGIAPLATFFILTSFLQQQYGNVLVVTLLTYGFATAAMLVPAVSEFHIATGPSDEPSS